MLVCLTAMAMLAQHAGVGNAHSMKPEPKRLGVVAARKLVANYVKRLPKTKENRSMNPELQDVTPNEVWNGMAAQVFKIKGYPQSVSDIESFMIRSGRVFPLSIGFGGTGLDSMCVADLDADGSSELLYTYSWGSGMHRSHIAAIDPNWPIPARIEVSHQINDATLTLRRLGSKNVQVHMAHKPKLVVGQLVMRRKGTKRLLSIKSDIR